MDAPKLSKKLFGYSVVKYSSFFCNKVRLLRVLLLRQVECVNESHGELGKSKHVRSTSCRRFEQAAGAAAAAPV